MPLKLVTGPANAAKAGVVLGGLRERLADEPILVVPALRDVDHAQRELAARGAVFGARVMRFEWLFREIAARAGYGEPVASDVQRELIVEHAVRRARLRALADSAERPGFARAALRFIAELERATVEPPRLARALRDWAAGGPRSTYADEVGRVFRLYAEGLERAGLVDPELYARRALDALRRQPGRWRGTPLFAYGFDDFTELELDALETIARRCEADVVVSLPFEAGRIALRAVAPVHARLDAIATERVRQPARADHYASDSRAALHHVERSLFEADAPERLSAGAAVRLHEAGGERAEVELVGAEVLGLLRAGTPPGEVAVVFRDPRRYASIVEQVFDAYGIPFSLERRVAFEHTALGRGVLALLRCASPHGSAADLLAYLRTPGRLRLSGLADELEREARRAGARDAREARVLWERRHSELPLAEIDRLAGARDVAELLARLEDALQRLFEGPYRRAARLLEGSELEDPRAFAAARDAIAELRALAEAGAAPALDARRLRDALARLELAAGEPPQPDRVQVAAPGAIRARRFAAVFVCGLQEGEFPAGAAPEPFLPDEDRRSLAAATGLRLPLREDRLDRERYLFYVCASRAERLLVLSSRACDEEGNPQGESFFVDDVRDLLDGLELRRRSLSDVTWPAEAAPTLAEWRRARALAGPRRLPPPPASLSAPPLLAELGEERRAVSAAALEAYADCPVKWLVDRVLRPLALEPDPEAMVRGSFAHEALRRTFERLRRETGGARVRPETLPDAERILLEELRELRDEVKLSPDETRLRAAARRLELDLLRWLRSEAEADGEFVPEHFQLAFGDGDAVEVDGVRVAGRIDRVDVHAGRALVIDYKTGRRVDSYKAASWESENRLQASLYMLAVERLLEGVTPAGGLYVALGGKDHRPRGMVDADTPGLPSSVVGNDRVPHTDFAARLDWARDRLAELVARMRRGEVRCTPDSCAWRGGCSHPSICRVEE